MDQFYQVIKTKIIMPRRSSKLLSRPRLIDLFFELLDRKLTIVTAPAGSGKTSLLIDMAHHLEWPVCWYALDELDQDLHRFIAHFIAAIWCFAYAPKEHSVGGLHRLDFSPRRLPRYEA
jgi:LuxR family maltose regulon positive regulatory protein